MLNLKLVKDCFYNVVLLLWRLVSFFLFFYLREVSDRFFCGLGIGESDRCSFWVGYAEKTSGVH